MKKPAVPEADSVEKIIQDILATTRTKDSTIRTIVEEVFDRAPVPLSSADVRRIVSKVGGRFVGESVVRSVLTELIFVGRVRFAGKQRRPTISGAMYPLPVYERVNDKPR